jgi:hypothetical protein
VRTTRRTGFLAAALVGAAAACGGNSGPPPLRANSTSYSFTVAPSEAPPHAREPVNYTITVYDRKTREPIQNGEGQLFASNREGSKTWDGMVYGPEVGTYHAKLQFVIAGEWAVAIRFRRDSLHLLERTDWMQDVLDERPDSAR